MHTQVPLTTTSSEWIIEGLDGICYYQDTVTLINWKYLHQQTTCCNQGG